MCYYIHIYLIKPSILLTESTPLLQFYYFNIVLFVIFYSNIIMYCLEYYCIINIQLTITVIFYCNLYRSIMIVMIIIIFHILVIFQLVTQLTCLSMGCVIGLPMAIAVYPQESQLPLYQIEDELKIKQMQLQYQRMKEHETDYEGLFL